MNRIEIAIVAIIVVAMSAMTVNKIVRVENMLETGSHLKNVKVLASIAPDAKWEDLPVFLKDDMAKGWSGNRLTKQELIDIRNYYNKRIAFVEQNKIADPISVGEDFKEMKLNEEKE